MPQSFAPWRPSEVASLNEYQNAGAWHPFTCPNRDLSPHRTGSQDVGMLEASAAGWICPDCGYMQDWAHDWMVDGTWRMLFAENLRMLEERKKRQGLG